VSTEHRPAIGHDPVGQRFSTEVDGQHAVLDYRLAGSVMTITHTGVPAAIGGRGVAAELMHAALETARAAGWTVIPACSYAAAYLRRHGDRAERQHEEDLLDEALDESFPASDPPSVGRSN
jgi:predicted GNAT family acetyltransferase